jgi:hypothetical protein
VCSAPRCTRTTARKIRRLTAAVVLALSLSTAQCSKPAPTLSASRRVVARDLQQHSTATRTEHVAMASEEPQISVMRGRALLLAAGAIWGTYAVLLKAINSGDAKPLPAIFVTAARYQFLCLFAFLQKKWFAFRDRGTASASAIGKGAPSAPNSGRTIAAAELAAIAVGSTLLSIWGGVCERAPRTPRSPPGRGAA